MRGTAEVVLGIDPGTATTGYGFVRGSLEGDGAFEVVAYGAVETPADDPMPKRLLAVQHALSHLVAEHRPSQAAVEKLFFGRNTTTAISVGQARGVVLAALAAADVPVFEYTAVEVKRAIAGFGRADKRQMQRMVQALLDLPEVPSPDDAADALAIALCHTRLARLRAAGLR
ncbi:MAG: crossover junction endodeoxyribonuclease RuvC [Chloroflexota bacterium]